MFLSTRCRNSSAPADSTMKPCSSAFAGIVSLTGRRSSAVTALCVLMLINVARCLVWFPIFILSSMLQSSAALEPRMAALCRYRLPPVLACLLNSWERSKTFPLVVRAVPTLSFKWTMSYPSYAFTISIAMCMSSVLAVTAMSLRS